MTLYVYDDDGYPLHQMSGRRVGELKEVDGRILQRKSLEPVDLEYEPEEDDE